MQSELHSVVRSDEKSDVQADVLNVAAYQFFDLLEPHSLVEKIKAFCKARDIRGTILLAHEGVNSFLSGTPEAIASYRGFVESECGFPPMDYKVSWTTHQPFTRMIVKVKKEIIAMGHDDVVPHRFTAQHLPAKEFKQWLDEGREVVIVDTRNDYEISLGKFKQAVDLNVASFREFAGRVKELPESFKDKPVVTYCTGGIRCEKAGALLLQKHGFKNVYQLEGGILKYFEEVGGAHFEGECFVFDKRIAVNPQLEETETTQCYACRTPLHPLDLRDSRYVPGESCVHCFDGKRPKVCYLPKHPSVLTPSKGESL